MPGEGYKGVSHAYMCAPVAGRERPVGQWGFAVSSIVAGHWRVLLAGPGQ